MRGPEPLLIGSAQIATDCGVITTRAVGLASCPGLLATESAKRRGSWVVTHRDSGKRIFVRDSDGSPCAAPLAAALGYIVALAATGIDWTASVGVVVQRYRELQAPPEAGQGWVSIEHIVPRVWRLG